MLLESPKFQKRIRETVLRSALIIPGGLPGTDEEKHPIPSRAVVQSVTFLGTNPEAKAELDCYREHIAHYSYTELPSELGALLGPIESEALAWPEISWSPYVGLPPGRSHPLQRDLEAGYSVLEAETEELIEYLKDSNPDVPANEEGAHKRRQQYPISAVAIHLPWGTPKRTENIPTPEQTATLLHALTQRAGRQTALCVSGPAKAVKAYTQKVLAQQGISQRTSPTLANIKVGEGYIVCDADPKEAEGLLDRFHSYLKLQRETKRLEACEAYCRKNIRRYIADKIAQEEAWDAMRLTSGVMVGATAIEERAELHKTFDDLRCKTQDYETHLAEIRRSTLGIAGRDTAIARETQADNMLSKLARACLRRTKALKLDSPKGEFPTAQALEETTTDVVDEFLQVLDAYLALQKTILETPHHCRFEPWATHIVLVRNRYGFLGSHAAEAFVLDTPCWGDKELARLVAHGKENRAAETSLGRSMRDRSASYPCSPIEPILNPGRFPKVPEGLVPTPLKDPTEPLAAPKVRLDIRLQPRADIWTEGLLDLDNLLVETYNPVAGKPTGFKDSTLWRPVITRRGVPQTEEALRSLGYELDCSAQTHNFVERKVRKAEKVLAPNYPLTPYEAMAYFENGPRPAEKTVVHPDTGETLWIEGKNYHITPSWRRQTMLVDHSVEDSTEAEAPESGEAAADATAATTAADAAGVSAQTAGAEDIVVLGSADNARRIQNAARISTLTERRINFGYSTFIVEAEGGKVYEIRETVTKDTIGMEKERIAVEIEHLSGRLETLETKREADLKVSDKNEMTKLRKAIEEKTRELDEWAPMLEDFLEAFPPQAPPLASEVYGEQIAGASKAIYARFAPFIRTEESGNETSLKDYQLKWASVGAVKRSHLDGSSPGSGKTICAIMSSWHMGHHYNWIICPTIAMKTWAAELERVGLYHEMVGYAKGPDGVYKPSSGPYEHMRRITQRFHKRVRMKNRLGKIEPEYYILSAEAVCLGGEGNKTYSPWHFDHPVQTGKAHRTLEEKLKNGSLELPPHWELRHGENGRMFVRVWSDRPDSAKEINAHGFKDYIKPVRFQRAVKRCPRCEAESPVWSRHGHCGACGHHHSGITRNPSGWTPGASSRLTWRRTHLTATPKKDSSWQGGKTSLRQVPLYKMMGKHVGCKIIDEIHNWSNFHSQHGAALMQVRSKDTIVLSGTLCKTHIAELEPSLCQVYEPNSAEFPYAPWGMDLFKKQFETKEMETTYRSRFSEIGESTRRRTAEKVVPEASNLTKLRALMHGVMCSVGETEMERVWNLQPIRESIRYVELQPRNAAIYAEWERLLQEAYDECKTEVERVGMLRRARSQITHLAYACDGPEKLEAAISWIQESIASGERCVVVGPSTRFYTMLSKALRERNIPFMAMGNTAPEKRYEVLNKFRDSDCPVFLSRIRLVNVNFNQLTCCTRILFTGIDPSPAAVRQMQKRLNRIGQTREVHCTFLITQMPRRQPINLEIEATLAALETGEQEPETEDLRPPSYEERLFALVLRRENAIKQTLQQADRQRDPQELYEMLRDRQTLNQLLEDIVTNAKTDPELTQKMRAMAETAEAKKPEATEVIEAASEILEVEPPTADAAGETRIVSTTVGARVWEGPARNAPEETTGLRFTWAPVRRKRPDILQGELFSL